MLSAVKLWKSVSMSGPSATGEAHIGEDLGDLVDDLADRMDAALGERAVAHRQRDVGRSAASRASSAARPSASRLASSASPTRSLQLLTAWPKLLRSSGGMRAERLHQLRDAALLAERGDAHRLERGEVCRLGDGAKQLAPRSPSSEAV